MAALAGGPLTCGRAHATELEVAPREGARLVLLDNHLASGDDLALRGALTELLGRIEVRVAPFGSIVNEPVLARVTIAPTFDGARVTVQPVDPPGPSVRHEVPESSSPELFRETLAHVVLGAVEPLLQAQPEPPAPPPPAPPPPRPDPTADRGEAAEPGPARGPGPALTAWVGARAGALWFVSQGEGGVLLGAAGGATLEVARRPGLALEAGYLLPLTIERDGLTATFSLLALRLRPSVELWSTATFDVRAELAPGISFVTLSPEETAADVISSGDSSRVQPMLGLAGAASFRLAPGLSAVARLGVDLDFAPRRWLIEGAARDVFFETTRLQPHTTLGIDWSPREAAR
jgi:hypothetical protein